MEEIPLIKSAYEEQRIKDMDLWEQQEEERVGLSLVLSAEMGWDITVCLFCILLLKKSYLFFIGKLCLQRGETERRIFMHWFTP